MQTTNPFHSILNELLEVKELLYSIKDKPELELKNKFYSVKEAAGVLQLDCQTIRSYISKGTLKAEKVGRIYRIKHFDLMDSLNDVKSLKYKR